MVRTSKTTDTPATPATKAKATKKTAVETAPVDAPVNEVSLAAEPTTDAPVADVPSVTLKMTEFSAKLQQLIGLFSTVKSDFKTLEKVVSREMKAAAKASSKKRRNNVNRKPSGFVKPALISDELATFLGKTVGSEMARTEVSKEITKYIKSNNLQDASNGRVIKADAKLSKLLRLGKDDELTFFNLQRYLKIHFIKAVVPVV